MPRRKKLPPGYPTRPFVRIRGPKHECPHCEGTTRPVKGQTLEQAIKNHEASCPAILRIKPTRKDKG